MCGIFGMTTNNKTGFTTKEQQAFVGMSVVNSLRGAHSTGVFGVHRTDKKKGQVDFVKVVGSPFMLFDWGKSWGEFEKRLLWDYNMAIGHGRQATHGAINADNAHPFTEDHITLVHNGVIRNWLILRDKSHDYINVDSHLVCKLIAEKGAKEILPKLQGAYVLVWYDEKEKSLNIARNKERPLFIADNKETLFFASEKETLVWANSRYDLNCESFHECPAFHHIVYKQGSLDPEIRVYEEEKWTPPKVPRQNLPALVGKVVSKIKQLVIDTYAEHLLNTIVNTAEVSIGIGDHIEIDLIDYETKETHTVIKGESARLPNVEFEIVTTRKISDEDLLNAECFRGRASSYYAVDPESTSNGASWKIFLRSTCMVSKMNTGKELLLFLNDGYHETKEELPWLELPVLDGTVERVSPHRYSQLLSQGCMSCHNQFTEKDADSPQSMMLLQGTKGMSLLCPNCADLWTNGELILKERS